MVGRDRAVAARLRDGRFPDLSIVDVTDEERSAILSGDVAGLHIRGVHGVLLLRLLQAGVGGLTPETYATRIRAAPDQMARP
jgi:hypothetical protein